MEHSNAALWTIPNFDFGSFLPILFWKSKSYFLHFKYFIPWSEGSYRSPLIWVWTIWKNNMDSLQRATRLKGLNNGYLRYNHSFNLSSTLLILSLPNKLSSANFSSASNFNQCFNVAQSWWKYCLSVKQLGPGWDAELLCIWSGSKLFALEYWWTTL